MRKTKNAEALELGKGRTVTIANGEDGEVIEVRGAGGTVELRIKMTAEGPVVKLEGARVQVNATETIEMHCKSFSVDASESLSLGSEGGLAVHSTGEMTIESTDECVIRGKMIRLN